MNNVVYAAYVFLALAIIGALFTIFVRNKKGGATYFIVKCFSSSIFVLLAILGALSRNDNKELSLFIIAGLVFGFLGDCILGAKEINKDISKKPFIISGILAFLIGHVLFSTGFILYSGVNLTVFMVPLGLSIVALIVFILLKYDVKPFLYAILWIYAFLEVLMASSAFNLIDGLNNPGFIVAFVGALFFCISDAVLSFIYFGPKKGNKNVLVAIELSTYYLGQILIASSIIFM